MRDAKRFRPRGFFSPLAVSLSLAVTASATVAQTRADATVSPRSFSIPAGPLAPALSRFAQEMGVALVIDASRVAGLKTQGLNGHYGVDEGFAQLLQGTGYAIQKTNAGYLLAPTKPAVAAARNVPETLATPAGSALASSPTASVADTPVASASMAEAETMETVIVQASRSNIEAEKAPQTVQIIGKADIERQLALSTNSSDVLSNLIPSYTPSRGKMNGSGETLRGRTPLILIDGVPQSNPIRPTGREAHTIDFSMVERIEVVQGANAVNGLGATGGTINLITKRPENGAFNQHVDVQATMPTSNIGSDVMGYKTTYRASGRQDRLDYLFAIAAEDQGLYRDAKGRSIGADNTQGDLMDSRSYDLLGKIGYWLDDNQRVQFSLNRYRIKSEANYIAVAGNRTLGTPTTSLRGTPEGTPPWNDVWTSSVSYNHYDLAGMELSAMAFHQDFEGLFGADNSATFQDAAIAPVGTLYDQSRAVSKKFGSKVTLTKADLLDHRLKFTTGFDTLVDKGKQDLYGTGRTYVPESEYRNLSLFLQGEYKPIDRWTLHGGVRKEYAELSIDSYRTLARYNRVAVQGGTLDFNQTLYNAGVVFEPTKDWNLFASYSEGFGMPDVGRVLRAINTPGQNVDDMQSLGPIVTKSVELGARFKRGAWEAEASYFRSNSDYGSRVIRVNDAFMLAREKNRIEGVEGSLGYRFNRAHKGKLSYARTKGRYDSDDNGSLDAKLDGLNVAPDRLLASWTAQWDDRLSSFVQVQHAFSKTFDDPAKRFTGYTLVDASLNYKLNKGTLRLAVANLFNRDYITYYSQSALVEPLRYFAGRGRTLTVGYSIDF
ncbi:TonB-dependent receptor domain-containing protein [Paracidovorax valerianellae]|uniref:Iron complex outermembrane recepter protein n=1 Tax=Paracidovorax valerianellae TaxID=187868 RepID=A0A1G6TUZ6_9BURK|nr:TonB-dependent receptor [Paracidovorax valerianellae]MDA8446926.1 TonB-dependent receptor [Paracidovorax valerianellae]SDD32135.1 iron complex outermembrane recepter protein [Paracidovorax valerianellae]